MSKRYIVFEKPAASKCWTLAHKVNPYNPASAIPAIFHLRAMAEAWVESVHSKRMGWDSGKPDQVPMTAHIVEVELP